jgi:hypothetical protein
VPYDPTDPRSQLSTAGAVVGVPREPSYFELAHSTATESAANGSRTRWTRSQALVIAHTEAAAGDSLAVDLSAEYALLVLEGAVVRIEHDATETAVAEPAVVIVPPGTSTVHIDTAGVVIRVFAAATSAELTSRCVNADDYAVDDVNVSAYAAWPDPPDGHRVRVYPLSEYPYEPGRLGAIFRCSTVMVNVLPQDDQPRDPSKLSPHHHDDFEQVSLQVAGDYVHHMRVPWTPDSFTWRDDEHRHCTAPAVVVIPPPLVHTSQSVGDMRHWLIDVFAPPRLDFSQRPGWVLNADEYPMPESV